MAITMAELKKNVKALEEQVDTLCKSASFTDGAATSRIEQLNTKAGSGKTADPNIGDMTSGAVVDANQTRAVQRGLTTKGGSGASVGSKFVGTQGGRYFNDGTTDSEEMIKTHKAPARGVKKGRKTIKKGAGYPTGPKGYSDQEIEDMTPEEYRVAMEATEGKPRKSRKKKKA